jgi:hypothetical protein
MATKIKFEPILYASDSKYIDPIGCDSKVSYKLVGNSYGLEAEVSLSDCNRHISWSFNEDPDALDKIDAAIGALCEFRKLLGSSQKRYKKDFPPEVKS